MDGMIVAAAKYEVRLVARLSHFKRDFIRWKSLEADLCVKPKRCSRRKRQKMEQEIFDGQTNVHDEPDRGLPTVSDETVARVEARRSAFDGS